MMITVVVVVVVVVYETHFREIIKSCMLGVYLKSCELTFIIALRDQFITMIKIGYIVFNYKD